MKTRITKRHIQNIRTMDYIKKYQHDLIDTFIERYINLNILDDEVKNQMKKTLNVFDYQQDQLHARLFIFLKRSFELAKQIRYSQISLENGVTKLFRKMLELHLSKTDFTNRIIDDYEIWKEVL